MLIRILLLFLFIAFSAPAFSQDDEQDSIPVKEVKKDKVRRGFIGVAFGPAFPSGNFGKSNFNNDNSGYAEMGYQFTAIDFGYKFMPSFGLSLSFKGANVPLDVKAIANIYASEYGGQFTVKSTRWNYGGIYIGPIVSIPTKIVDVDFRFNTGIMMAFSPEMEITRGQEYVKQEESVGPSISITLGVGARIHISRSFSATAGIEYLRARPTFLVEYSSNNSIQQERVYQDITTLNASVGIAWRIF